MITIVDKIWGKPSLWEKRPVEKRGMSLLCEKGAELLLKVAANLALEYYGGPCSP
jgi:hypothetical protein